MFNICQKKPVGVGVDKWNGLFPPPEELALTIFLNFTLRFFTQLKQHGGPHDLDVCNQPRLVEIPTQD